MSEQEKSPLERVKVEKKLRKREQKLRERLRRAERAQEDALERLRHAEARMHKRMARVQRLEERLSNIQQRLRGLQGPRATVITMITAAREEGDVGSVQMMGEAGAQYLDRFFDTHVIEEEDRNEFSGGEKEDVEEGVIEREAGNEREVEREVPVEEVMVEVSEEEVGMGACEARVVAEVAEEAARDAIERVAEAEEYLKQLESARHLIQELERLHVEADRATTVAREAGEAAQAAERKVGGEQRENASMSSIENEERTESKRQVDTDNVRELNEPEGHPSQLEVAQVEEIEEEEEKLETVTAMIIADAAAIAAARAEAVAEACSARTREARELVVKADRALEAVRVAIRRQKLSGEGAEVALRAAEREATHAHAVLADAELAEERALNAAMNAEAEAEVAEGMAFASSSRDERDEKRRDEITVVQPGSYTAGPEAGNERVEEGDDDDTLKVRVIRPQGE